MSAVSQPTDFQRRWSEIEGGRVLAWGEHITGQDTDTRTTWHDFKSVATIHGRSAKENGDVREDDELWAIVDRGDLGTFVEQFQALDWGDDADYCWFVDAGPSDANSLGRAATPGTPEIPAVATYKLTFISENKKIWGIPVGDGAMTAGLDVDGVAVDIGGGITGLPFLGHPFTAGEVVRITSTTNYNGEFTLEAGTSANQLQITDGYVAETFDGTEIVVQYINLPIASSGRMDIDADGNLYAGHGWYAAGSTFITKVEPDGTQVYDFFDASEASEASLPVGLKATSDSTYLYMYMDRGRLEKYDLLTGDLKWSIQTRATGHGYYMVLDSEDNAYLKSGTISPLARTVAKFSSLDGSILVQYTYTTSSHAVYALAIDEDMGILVGGGHFVAGNDDATLWNLTVRALDNLSGAKIALGGTYADGALWYTYIIGSGNIIIHDGYIYVLSYTPTCTLYKLDSDLNIITEVAGPSSGQGFYVDLWDNIVVVNQDASATKDDVLWFYDSGLAYITKISGMPGMLSTWAAPVGGAWIQGDAVWVGDLGTATPAVPGTPGVEPNYVDVDVLTGDVCVYADGIPLGVFTVFEDANGTNVIDLGAEYDVVIAGINYYSIYESFPLIPQGDSASIKDVKIDFYESMGCNVGVDIDNSVDWTFSYDDFATSIEPVTEIKTAPFVWGSGREPVIYLWTWIPVPNTIRSINPKINVTIDR